MASVNWQKMTKQTAGAMKRHNGKKERTDGNHTNKHIDKSKSHLNVYIGADDYDQMYKAMLKRVEEVDKIYPPLKKLKADERVICESLEYKCPQAIYDLGYETAVRFFNDVHKIFIDFFGAENVHGSCIHFDEIHDYVDPQTKHTYTSLPHAHSLVSCYVEWEEDIKKGGKKTGEKRERKGINGKNFEKRERYNKLNKKIDDYCLRNYGIHFLTGEQAKKKTVEILKSESALAETNLKIEAAKKQLLSEQQASEKLRQQREENERVIKKAKSETEALTNEIQEKKKELSDLDTLRIEYKHYHELEVNKEDVSKKIKVNKPSLLNKKETVTLDKNDFDKILEQSYAYIANRDEFLSLRERSSALDEREKKLNEEQKNLEQKQKDLESKTENIKRLERDTQRRYEEQLNINKTLQDTKRELNRYQKLSSNYSVALHNEKLKHERTEKELINKIDDLNCDMEKMRKEKTNLQNLVAALKNTLYKVMIKFSFISNHLKYEIEKGKLSNESKARIKSVQQFTEEACDLTHLSPDQHEKILQIQNNKLLNADLSKRASDIFAELNRTEEKTQEHYRGMTR